MNNKVLMGIIVVLVLLLAWIWTDRDKLSECCAWLANDLSVGRPDHRTWVVYEADEMNPPHLVVGDAFRIRRTHSDHKLVPLTWLRGRWKVRGEFEVDLVEGTEGLLCGKVVLPGGGQGKDRVFKLQGDGKDRMNIGIEVLESDEWECTEIEHKHGGTAHAEN